MAHSDWVHVRIKPDVHQRFRDKCEEMNRQYPDTIRELIEAFAEGRVKITPTEANKELYNVD